jgi:hypothetical protein
VVLLEDVAYQNLPGVPATGAVSSLLTPGGDADGDRRLVIVAAVVPVGIRIAESDRSAEAKRGGGSRD